MLHKLYTLHNIFIKPGKHAALFNPERFICLHICVSYSGNLNQKVPGNAVLYWQQTAEVPHMKATLIQACADQQTVIEVWFTFLPESAPGVTMEGFNNMPSNSTLLSARYLKVAAQISSATSAVLQRQDVVSVQRTRK